MESKITTLENGDLLVEQEYFDGQDMATLTRTFTTRGNHVYQVWPNGATQQVCNGLSLRGYTLQCHGNLEDTIRANIN